VPLQNRNLLTTFDNTLSFYQLSMNSKPLSVNSLRIFILFFTITISLLPFQLKGQTDIEETEKLLPSMVDDTAKVQQLLLLGEHYCSNDNDKALLFLQDAYSISIDQNYTEGIGKSLMWLGRVYYYKSNYTLSNRYLDKAKRALEKTGDLNTLSFWYLAKAFSLRASGDYAHAIKMTTKSIDLCKKTGNKKRMTTCYLVIGSTFLDRGDADKAMKYFREGLSLAKEANNKVVMANALTSIASAYKAKGLPDTSLFYYQKALNIRTGLKIDRHIASSEVSIGNTLIELGRYKEAEQALRNANEIFRKLDERTGVVLTNLSLAKVLTKQGNPAGIKLSNETLKTALKINNPNLLNIVYNKLSEIYADHQDFEKAYLYQKEHDILNDSLFTSKKERMLAEIEAKFQTEKKDRDIAFLKEKTAEERNRNILLIILLVVFLLVIFLLIIMFRYKSTAFTRQQKLLEQEKIIHAQENEIAEKEKQLLQEQLESKNRELASKALEMIRMNETISEIIEKLEEFNNTNDSDPKMTKSIKEIIHDLETHTKQNIWNEFDKIFKNIHTGFYARLLEVCPNLTSTEIKTAALLKLNLTTKEIAAITFKSEGGIKTTRYRLRKKLGLSGDDKLVPFLMQI
jgi:tetratricopeptide (TPR) repeat protein/DNA-binding CsgD family transcriptional regulator